MATNTFFMEPVSNPQKMAVEFCRILNEWLTPEELDVVRYRNAMSPHKDCCATHDFCDANEAMAEAFKLVIGHDCLLPSDSTNEEQQEAHLQADCDLMNEAWGIAKANQFRAGFNN